jgi:hypothetical protein
MFQLWLGIALVVCMGWATVHASLPSELCRGLQPGSYCDISDPRRRIHCPNNVVQLCPTGTRCQDAEPNADPLLSKWYYHIRRFLTGVACRIQRVRLCQTVRNQGWKYKRNAWPLVMSLNAHMVSSINVQKVPFVKSGDFVLIANHQGVSLCWRDQFDAFCSNWRCWYLRWFWQFNITVDLWCYKFASTRELSFGRVRHVSDESHVLLWYIYQLIAIYQCPMCARHSWSQLFLPQ